ncbi:MAG: hypothetical protein AUK47_26460 [Deltaproteobacteria bacterium CG2_30_63_29]|nr:MAG: hypothetical protein AUK47_26460 [Deltaproteobacteria bacterium CG2_30_63_29]
MFHPTEKRALAIGLGLTLAAGAALRLLYIGDEGFWFDEFWIWRQSQMGARELLADMIDGDVHPPLYQLFILAWTALFGASEVPLRLPSALFGIASIAALFGYARGTFGARIGLVSAGLLACSEYAVYYSQEARSYSLLLLLSITSAWALSNATADARLRSLALYALSGVLLAYTHVFGMLFLVFLAFGTLVSLWRKENGALTLKRWFWVHVVMAAAFAPWVPALLHQASRVQKGFWIPPLDWLFFASYFAKYSGGRPLGWLALALVLSALWTTWRHRDRLPSGESLPASKASKVVTLVAWFVFMLGVPFVISKLGEPIMHAKSAISVLAPLSIIMALGLYALPAKLRWGVLILWVAGSLGSIVWTNYRAQNREGWREMSVDVAERFDADRDLVLLYHPDFDYMFCYRYYLPKNIDAIEMICADEACNEPLERLEARASAEKTERLWVMRVRSSTVGPPHLEDHWQVGEEHEYNNGLLQLLLRRN